MATLDPSSWTTTDAWEQTVSPQFHDDFRRGIADATREGLVVESVTVIGGVPISFNTRERTS